MAELTPQERLQPCLLDRLTDDEPGTQLESRERRVMSLRQLRQAVLRDLAWLLNCNSHLRPDEADEFPEVAKSVLNFGMPDLCGLTASGINPAEVQRMIREAVLRYEPRILPSSLRVTAGKLDEAGHNAIFFEIQGELWAQPTPEPLYLRTEVDLETGQCLVQERGHG